MLEKEEIIRELNDLKDKYLNKLQLLPAQETHTSAFRIFSSLMGDLSNFAFKAEHGITWAEHCAMEKQEWEKNHKSNGC